MYRLCALLVSFAPLRRHSHMPHFFALAVPILFCSTTLAIAGLAANEDDAALARAADDQDSIHLSNGHTIYGEILSDEGERTINVKTRGGILTLKKEMVLKVVLSFARRKAQLEPTDYLGHLTLALWAESKGRYQDAYDLLRPFAYSNEITHEGLRLLAELSDRLRQDTPEMILNNYRRYQQRGGKNANTLARHQELENIYQNWQKKAKEVALHNDSIVIDEGMEVRGNWQSEDPKHSNPISASLTTDPGNSLDRVLKFSYKGGKEYKAVCRRKWALNVSKNHKLSFEVFNAGSKPVSISVAVKSSDKWIYFESKPWPIKAEQSWQPVVFDLLANDFKSEASNWAHTTRIKDPSEIREVQLQIHNQRDDGVLYLNNMGFLSGD